MKGAEMRCWDLDTCTFVGEEVEITWLAKIHVGKTHRSARVGKLQRTEVQQSFLKLAIDQLDIPTSKQYLVRDKPHGFEVVDKLPCRFFPVWGSKFLSCQPRKESM
jgi:hypothetical protein